MNTQSVAPNRRILVIDDNESIHHDFRKILTPATPGKSDLANMAADLFGESAEHEGEADFHIDSAFQGQQGLEMVRVACTEQLPYAMAFVDIRMPPGWDGIETISNIWNEYPELQVVICTAYSDYSLEQIVKKLGRTDRFLILKKPFDSIEVKQLAFGLTEKWRLARQVRVQVDELEDRVLERTRELREEQQRLVEARKMELVGKLAGGIAHDFNTLLTSIIGHADLIRQKSAGDDDLSRSAVEIGNSANCAARLTQQLLAFSRRQMLRPERLDANEVVTNLQGRLCELMGGAIEIRVASGVTEPWIKADPAQLDDVLISLCHNARDAMPHGGILEIGVAEGGGGGANPALPAGDYVEISIRDTGMGIDEEVRKHLFEPFFTTKPQGESKGLGLAVCYGIIKQSGGEITVESRTGVGSTITVHLPRDLSGGQASEEAAPELVTHSSGPAVGHVLVVEPEPAFREMTASLLRKMGHTVYAAGSAHEAIEIAAREKRVDLLITDTAMTDMSGSSLAGQIATVHSRLRVLFISGDRNGDDLLEAPSFATFLRKPYSPSNLTTEVSAALSRGALR